MDRKVCPTATTSSSLHSCLDLIFLASSRVLKLTGVVFIVNTHFLFIIITLFIIIIILFISIIHFFTIIIIIIFFLSSIKHFFVCYIW